MSNKRVFKFLALSLAFTFAGVLSAPAEVLLSETWDVAIDSLKWATEARPAASQGAGQVSLTETEDVGGGDYAAYTEGPSDWNWGQELETVDTFARGNNLRCTFTTWYDPTASYPSAAPGGSAINGPFHSASMMGGNQSHSALEAAVGREYGSFLFEQASWGGGPAISAAFHVAYASATSKANAVKIKVTLGDASGAMLQWSNDSGYSWTTEYDTRGVSGPTNSPVYVGFGTNHGQIFYDDIIVENDVVVETLLSETWDVAIDPLTWATEARPAGSQGAGQASLAETEDVGGGDFAAYTEGPSDWGWGQELVTVGTFPRGDNLICTFTTWYDPTANYSGAAPGGSAINGPFHNDTVIGGNQTHTNSEAMASYEYQNSMRFDQDDSWGGERGLPSGPVLSASFHAAYAAATSKANGLKIKVTLGNASGAMFEWWDQGGTRYLEADNRGEVASPTKSVGSAPDVYVGWGTHHGQIFYDDITVTTDQYIPAARTVVNISGGGTDVLLSNGLVELATESFHFIIQDSLTYTETALLFVGPRWNGTSRVGHKITAATGQNPTINMDGNSMLCYGGSGDVQVGSAEGGRIEINDTLVGAYGLFWYINQESRGNGNPPGTFSCNATLENLDITSLTGRGDALVFGAGGDDATGVLTNPTLNVRDVCLTSLAAVHNVVNLMHTDHVPLTDKILNLEDSQFYSVGGLGIVNGGYGLGDDQSVTNISNCVSYSTGSPAFTNSAGTSAVDHSDLFATIASGSAGVTGGATIAITNSIIYGVTGTVGSGNATATDSNIYGSQAHNVGYSLTNVINEWPVYISTGDKNHPDDFGVLGGTTSSTHGSSPPLGSVGVTYLDVESWKMY